jgi:hypothetical protein
VLFGAILVTVFRKTKLLKNAVLSVKIAKTTNSINNVQNKNIFLLGS